MKIEIPKTLKELGKIFKAHNYNLYIVGGYVRNSLLGFVETDMDICGAMRFDEVQKMIAGTIFSCHVVNQNLGTLLIKSKVSEEEFEYTTFRKESYISGGQHSPKDVVFIDDIKTDCLRRDFTCNAIYYDVCQDEFKDFCGGINDVLAKRLKTVNTPEITFNDDGLRILRLVRMACELDFQIEDETFAVAKEKISYLKDISTERFNKEIMSILFSDYKYDAINNPNAPARGVGILSQLGAWGYIFQELSFTYGTENINKKLNSPWAFYLSQAPSIHRVSVFTYEILKALGLEINKENTLKILGENGLMLSKKEALLQAKLIGGIEKIKTITSEDEMRIFIAENSKIIARMLNLAHVFGFGQAMTSVYKIMKSDNVPLSIKDLDINGNDLKKIKNIKEEEYSKVLNNLLIDCVLIPELNIKHKLIKVLKEKYK